MNGEGPFEILFREIMPNLLPYIVASFVGTVSSAILAVIGLEALGLGAPQEMTLGNTIYWSQQSAALLRGMWWWWLPPIIVIALIFARAVPDLDRLRPLRQPAAEPAMTGDERAREGNRRRRAGAAVEDLEVHYDTPEGPAKAVNEVSFALRAGERLGLIGKSGSGKTTMAMALMRLTRPPGRIAGGRIELDGRDLLAMSEAELRQTRLRDIALVPQGAMSSLNPVMRLGDQIVDAILAHRRGLRRAELAARVAELLRNVGLDPAVAERYPHELSGGMKQRAVMAIATCLSPKVIIADEPTSALDVVVQRQVMQTLGRLQDGLGAAVVLIGHDMGLIAQSSDTVGVMYAGRIVEIGPVRQIIEAPRHPYTRLLIDSLPGIERKQVLRGIPGLPPRLVQLPQACSFHPRCPFAFERCRQETPLLQRVGPEQDAGCHLYPQHDRLPTIDRQAEPVT